MRRLLTAIFFSFVTVLGFTQTDNISNLSIKQIMKGEAFVGYLPENHRWTEDSKQIVFSWNPDRDTLRNSYQVNISDKRISKLLPEELKSMPPSSGDYNIDFSKKVYEKNGDLFLLDVNSNQLDRITNTVERERDPVFSGDEKLVIFRQGQNMFSWKIGVGSIEQLTNFKSGTDKKDPKPEDDKKWLEQDQLAYFDILNERKETEETTKYRNELIKPKRPAEVFFGDKQLVSMSISPDTKYVVYMLMKKTKDQGTIVPDFVTQSGYTKDLPARSKVGSEQNSYETWIFNRTADSSYQIKTDNIPGICDKPAYRQEYEKSDSIWMEVYMEPREVIALPPKFSEDGKAVFVVRSQDNKDRWIMQLNLADGSSSLLDRQRDEAWIGGPGISGWNFTSGSIGWLDNNHIWYQSEETGYAHIYRQNVNNGKKKPLTQGNFEILKAQLSNDKKTFFVTSNMESPHQHHFYHMSANGGKMKKISYLKGGHEVVVSPDEQMLAIRFSTSNKPWELYMMKNESGAEMVQLTESLSSAFKKYPWRVPSIVQFDARDGIKVPARIYQPEDGKKNGAAIIFVHGAGYLQNVHEWWSRYFREYMFHNMLTDNGYTVLDIDYRASEGYGRDWRTGIYRFMGGKDLDDQIDGANYLVQKHGIDPDRIGIYGGSYGGFMTLMALFTSPGTFKCGAALRSVTDWAHYNHDYTSNILNTPVEDSIAFAKSSPIYHAEGLQGKLLMLHGMVDTNVQFQDVVRLSQRLIELEKENWELAVFPMEGHGFKESSSWADEYRRIFELFQTTLR